MVAFIFPFSLTWGILLIWLYRLHWPVYGLWLLSAAAFSLVFFIPPEPALMLWLPGGLGVFLFAAALVHQFARLNKDKREVIELELPSRKHIKEALTRTMERPERQRLYLGLVREFSDKIKSQILVLEKSNTYFLLLLFCGIFLLSLSAIEVNISSSVEIQKAFTETAEAMKQRVPQGVDSEELAQAIDQVMRLLPALIFIANCLIMMFFLRILEFLFKNKPGLPLVLGRLLLFRLPEWLIWFFIAAGAAFAYTLGTEVDPLFGDISLNLLVIMATLYVFQGLAVVLLFLKVRLLPATWMVASFFLMGLVLKVFMELWLISLLLLGVLDFWFDFRKKALQPKILSKFDL